MRADLGAARGLAIIIDSLLSALRFPKERKHCNGLGRSYYAFSTGKFCVSSSNLRFGKLALCVVFLFF